MGLLNEMKRRFLNETVKWRIIFISFKSSYGASYIHYIRHGRHHFKVPSFPNFIKSHNLPRAYKVLINLGSFTDQLTRTI